MRRTNDMWFAFVVGLVSATVGIFGGLWLSDVSIASSNETPGIQRIHVVRDGDQFNAIPGDLVIDLDLTDEEDCLDAGGVPSEHACVGVDF